MTAEKFKTIRSKRKTTVTKGDSFKRMQPRTKTLDLDLSNVKQVDIGTAIARRELQQSDCSNHPAWA